MTMTQSEQIAEMIEGGKSLVPSHMWHGVEGYFLHGCQPGGFLTALLSNDLMGAVGKADDTNADAIREWCQFLYNYAPSGSYGSPEAVESWCAAFADQVAA